MGPIHDNFLPILKVLFNEDLANVKTANDHIITYKNKPILSISKTFSTTKKKVAITRKLLPYAFRHAFATNVVGAVGDLKSTSEILGHSRPDTTTRTYHYTDLSLLRRSVNKLPPLDLPDGGP